MGRLGQVLDFHLQHLGQDVALAAGQLAERALQAAGGRRLGLEHPLEAAAQLAEAIVADCPGKADQRRLADIQRLGQVGHRQKGSLVVAGQQIGGDPLLALGQARQMVLNPVLKAVQFLFHVAPDTPGCSDADMKDYTSNFHGNVKYSFMDWGEF